MMENRLISAVIYSTCGDKELRENVMHEARNSDKSMEDMGWVAIADTPTKRASMGMSCPYNLVVGFLTEMRRHACDGLIVVYEVIDEDSIRFWAKDIYLDEPVPTQLCTLYDIKHVDDIIAVIPKEGLITIPSPHNVYSSMTVNSDEEMIETIGDIYKHYIFRDLSVELSHPILMPICGDIKVEICEYTDVMCITPHQEHIITIMDKGKYLGSERAYICQDAISEDEDATGDQRCCYCDRKFTRSLVHYDDFDESNHGTGEYHCDECLKKQSYSHNIDIHSNEREFRRLVSELSFIDAPNAHYKDKYIPYSIIKGKLCPNILLPIPMDYPCKLYEAPLKCGDINDVIKDSDMEKNYLIKAVFSVARNPYGPNMEDWDKEDGYIVSFQEGNVILILLYVKKKNEDVYSLLGHVSPHDLVRKLYHGSIRILHTGVREATLFLGFSRGALHKRVYHSPRMVRFNVNENIEFLESVKKIHARHLIKGER